MHGTSDTPDSWSRLAEELSGMSIPGAVYIIGAGDSGKSTFAAYLCRRLTAEGRTAEYVDLDPGQSRFGPPTTVGLARWHRGGPPELEALRFVGSTSPPGTLLQHAAAASALRRRNAGLRFTIIDACGFVQGPMAEKFQYNLIDILRPEIIVRLGSAGGPRRSSASFIHAPGMTVHQLPVSDAAAATSAEERRRNRLRSYAEYFRGARQDEIPLRSAALHGKVPDLSPGSTAGGLLVGFCDAEQWLLALGIVSSVDPGGNLRYVAPPFPREKTAALQFGSLRLIPENGHLLER